MSVENRIRKERVTVLQKRFSEGVEQVRKTVGEDIWKNDFDYGKNIDTITREDFSKNFGTLRLKRRFYSLSQGNRSAEIISVREPFAVSPEIDNKDVYVIIHLNNSRIQPNIGRVVEKMANGQISRSRRKNEKSKSLSEEKNVMGNKVRVVRFK